MNAPITAQADLKIVEITALPGLVPVSARAARDARHRQPR